MTRARNLKQTIRSRAARTGESYTAARVHVLSALDKRRPRPSPPPVAPTPAPETGGGLSDRAVREKTGHGLGHWFAVLDAFGAASQGHTAAARHLRDDHGIPGWHSQGITVAYERARGLRAVNQAKSGFQVAVTKMLPVDLETALRALRPSARKAWLAGADPALRRPLEAALAKGAKGVVRGPRRSRVRYEWDGASVELVFEPRGKGTSVAAANTKLRDAAQVAERRGQWRTALDALKDHLTR